MVMEADPILTMTRKRAQQPAQKVVQQRKAASSKPPKKKKLEQSLGESMSRESFQKPSSVAAAYATGKRTRVPKIIRSSDRVRIVHSELISSISGSVAFTQAGGFALNPGLAATFPWLSSQAQGWERYRFNRLRFCYYTRTGSNTPGSFMMAPDYDASDSAPVSEQIASAYKDVVEDAPWKNICCELDPSSLNSLGPSRFIRLGALSANQDVKTYDAGNLFAFTIDGTAVPWGKLWVEYDVELITPQLNASGSVIASSQAMKGVPTSTDMIGTTPTTVSGSSNLFTVSGEVMTFLQAGQYLVVLDQAATTVTVVADPTAGAGGVIVNFQNTASGVAEVIYLVQMTAVVGSTLTFNNTIASGVNASLMATVIPGTLGDSLL